MISKKDQLKWKKPKKKRRSKKTSYTRAKEVAWQAFSKYIRIRDCIKTTGTLTSCICISCGERKDYDQIQAGHFIPGRNNAVLFDDEQVNGQCIYCNRHVQGNWVGYRSAMVREYGEKKVKQMEKDSKKIVKYTIPDLNEIEERYKKRLEILLNSYERAKSI